MLSLEFSIFRLKFYWPVLYIQDEAGTAAVKTVELDAALGGRAVQYREVQGHETEKFLSYFKPCIIPQEGGVASGFKHAELEEHKTRLFICKGKHVVHVKEASWCSFCSSYRRLLKKHDSLNILFFWCNRFLLPVHHWIMMIYLFSTPSLKFFSLMVPIRASKKEQKHWKLYSTLKILIMMGDVK